MAEVALKKENVLAVSINNDHIKIGLLAEGEQLATYMIATPKECTADEAESALYAFFSAARRQGLQEIFQPTGSIIASVVPSLTGPWTLAAKKICISRPIVIGPGLKTGLKMTYNDPSEIGADRIANIVAGKTFFDEAFIVADLGTTTNLSVVNNEGAFCGGIICPGLRISASMLAQGAARLSDVDIKAPKAVVGKSTKDAMRSGMVMGEIARLDGLTEMIWSELGYKTELLATGTDVAELSSLSKHKIRVEENLTLAGLGILYSLNR